MGQYFALQKEWTSEAIETFLDVAKRFVRKLQEAIWRPVVRNRSIQSSKSEKNKNGPYLFSLVKAHTLLCHVASFVNDYGFWGIFSEERFEAFQKERFAIRENHAPNKCIGSQLPDNMMWASVIASPSAHVACVQAERICLRNGSIRARNLSQE